MTPQPHHRSRDHLGQRSGEICRHDRGAAEAVERGGHGPPPLPSLSLPAGREPNLPLAKDEDEPHPLLIALVQAMARNAARKDYAASQRGDDD
ncbi:hypothetical protein EP867_18430 [Falsigemmobacter intermedius]|uniref:Uncharacterized protein n=1 Tax=Falsigemmobacter intermedius TaxID=1553448 RepID=A0A451GGJ9_9RHOB|nr:hypothetical protein EP867_18430 [Falsigemmobacter intermedius]